MEFDQETLGELDHLLSTVRSVRRRIDFDREVEDSVLLECVDIAVQAPTGRGDEDWRFLVVKKRETIMELADIYREVLLQFVEQIGTPIKASHQALIDRLGDFPAMIIVCREGTPENSFSSQTAYFGSILPAAWSLMIALRSREIGCTWTTLLSARHEEVGQILGIPVTARQIVMLPIGYCRQAVLSKAERKHALEVSFLDKWGEHFNP